MISIIIPIYNCKQYIERCVNSILGQKCQNELEILIVDDGSDDGSAEICDMLAVGNDNVTVIHQSNKGVSSARNVAIEIAKGEYIFFVDADDLLPENALNNLECAIEENAGLFMGSVLSLGDREPLYMYSKKAEISAPDLAYEMMCTPATRLMMSGVWGKIFKTKIIRENEIRFDEKLKNGEDGKFIVEYLSHIGKAVNIKDMPPVYYLMRYPIEERASAVTAIYPDFFIFHVAHSESLYVLLGDVAKYDMEKFYQAFINELIIHLVRAYAYKDFFDEKELRRHIAGVVNRDLVSTAIRSYRRKNRSDSILIPDAIRFKSISLLDSSLSKRGEKYRNKNTRKGIVTSIYR